MNNKSYILVGAAVIVVGFLALKKDGEPLFRAHSDQETLQRVMAEQMANPTPQSAKPYLIATMPTFSGSYLSARFAVSNDDLLMAGKYYQDALEISGDEKEKAFLYDVALPSVLAAGDIPGALVYAEKMDLSRPNVPAQLGLLTQLVEGFRAKDYKNNDALLAKLRSDGFGRLLKPLLESWNAAGEKDFVRAEAILQKLKQEYPSLRPLVQMHMAFLSDLQGKEKQAATLYNDTLENNLSIRSAYIAASFYEHHGQTEKVKKLYEDLAKTMPASSLPQIVLQRIEQKKPSGRAFISRPLDGVAAALYDVASVLHQEGSSHLAILYAQMAHYLVPDDHFSRLLLSDILASDPHKERAEAFLLSVPETSDLYVLAQMRLAQLYEQQEQPAKAITIWESFLKNPLTKEQATIELGDLYRRKEDFAKAIPYYTEILSGKKQLEEADWVLLYSRGMCYERNNQWDLAEKDLVRAMELSPRQPEVLNYLAYSWADHGKNLPQALDMLQKALAGAPNDPYIIDSVGWALYKNGQADEAVAYLESAVQELPADPVINGHLGDIYWAVGRRLEAGFQWQRALKNTKETDVDLRREFNDKIKNGLTAKK